MSHQCKQVKVIGLKMSCIIRCLLLAAAIGVCFSLTCPPDGFVIGESCYVRLGFTYGVRETWPNAENMCKEEGGHLATLTTAIIQKLWTMNITSPPAADGMQYWIGLHTHIHKHPYVNWSSLVRVSWSDGSLYNSSEMGSLMDIDKTIMENTAHTQAAFLSMSSTWTNVKIGLADRSLSMALLCELDNKTHCAFVNDVYDLDIHLKSDHMTPQLCQSYCLDMGVNFKYALTKSLQCYCTNFTINKVSIEKCNFPCVNEDWLHCGGTGYENYYTVVVLMEVDDPTCDLLEKNNVYPRPSCQSATTDYSECSLGSLPSISGATFNWTHYSTSPGFVSYYFCDQAGYALNASNALLCEPLTGHWLWLTSKNARRGCVAATECTYISIPPAQMNVNFLIVGVTRIVTYAYMEVFVRCKNPNSTSTVPYVFADGSLMKSFVCQLNGSWSGNMPVQPCVPYYEDNCPRYIPGFQINDDNMPVSEFINSQTAYNAFALKRWPVGSKRTVWCELGYVFNTYVSYSTAECKNNKQWEIYNGNSCFDARRKAGDVQQAAAQYEDYNFQQYLPVFIIVGCMIIAVSGMYIVLTAKRGNVQLNTLVQAERKRDMGGDTPPVSQNVSQTISQKKKISKNRHIETVESIDAEVRSLDGRDIVIQQAGSYKTCLLEDGILRQTPSEPYSNKSYSTVKSSFGTMSKQMFSPIRSQKSRKYHPGSASSSKPAVTSADSMKSHSTNKKARNAPSGRRN